MVEKARAWGRYYILPGARLNSGQVNIGGQQTAIPRCVMEIYVVLHLDRCRVGTISHGDLAGVSDLVERSVSAGAISSATI